MKNFIFLIVLLLQSIAFAQTYKITYHSYFEGKKRENFDPIIAFVNEKESYILSQKILESQKPVPYEVQRIDRKTQNLHQFAFLKDNHVSQFIDTAHAGKYSYTHSAETKEILGYTCHKAVTNINSNTMEIWYTKELSLKGGPSTLGQELGLVLEIVRNGNSATRATEITKVKQFQPGTLFGNHNITTHDGLTHRDLIWQSRFTKIPVFHNETINFIDNPQSNDSVYRYAHGTIILRKIQYPNINATDNLFVELTEQSRGDAYDRTGTVFVITKDREKSFFHALQQGIDSVPQYQNSNQKVYKGVVLTSDYTPPTELMRFFTPFGVQHFNHLQIKNKEWHEKVTYRQDITELAPLLSNQELWTGVFIGNYDQGGHEVSLEITQHQDGINVFKNNFALPIFNTLNIMEMAGQDYATMFSSEEGLLVEFTLDQPLQNAQLRYITTGHGGWEHGDEFVPKPNKISLNEQQITSFIPWRSECGSYRLYNPASGNFHNGLSSSDLSRSNWCPATATPPQYIDLGDLPAGKHSIRVQIPLGEPQGSSFSAWNVSGILIGTTG
ncbi:MAG: PNGase F N-terminal domain-containing protein [Weeksellaceae bacterium]|nr:PNGase F N-terminal domain-containing protein [Weeksellaceae bacterium]